VLLLLASKLRDRQHKAGAAGLLRQALLSYPKDFWLHLELGITATDPVEKVGCFTAALAVRPGSAPAHLSLGNALLEKKDLDGALSHYHKALAIAPNYADAHCNLGHTLGQQGRFAAALQSLKTGHELGSKLPSWKYPSAQWIKLME